MKANFSMESHRRKLLLAAIAMFAVCRYFKELQEIVIKVFERASEILRL